MVRLCGPLLVVMALASCAAERQNASPEWTSAKMCKAAQLNWLVVDRPEKSLLVIQHDSFGQRSSSAVLRSVHEQAAIACLSDSGRACRLLAGTEIERTIYQFAYDCAER
jgi:hypothetical protein